MIKSDCVNLILRRLEVMIRLLKDAEQEAAFLSRSDVTVTPGISMQSVSGRG